MKIERDKALALLAFCGFKSASQWDNERIGAKIPSIKDVMDQGQENDQKGDSEETLAMRAFLREVIEKTNAGEKFEVVGESTTKPKDEPKESKTIAKKDNSAYHSGVVVKEFGTDKGVTDEMLNRYYELRGRTNKDVATANLKWAISVVKGFIAEA